MVSNFRQQEHYPHFQRIDEGLRKLQTQQNLIDARKHNGKGVGEKCRWETMSWLALESGLATMPNDVYVP